MTPIPHPELSQALKASQKAWAHYQQQDANFKHKIELVGQQVQTVEAAESSARSFKEQARSALRELLGKPTKKLRDLRAEERAAYSMAEDYRYFVAELELARDEAELDMLEAGRQYVERRDGAMDVYAGVQMQTALAQLEPLLLALHLQENRMLSAGAFATWTQRGFDTAVEVVLHDFGLLLKQRLAHYQPAQDNPTLQALPWQDALHAARTASPLQIKARREALIKRKQVLDAES